MAQIKNSTLDDIAAVIGFSATVRLAAHYADRDLMVPHTVSELHPVAKLIGVSCLTRLVTEWPGERLSIPTLDIYDTERRSAHVIRLMLHNVPDYSIALIVGLSVRRIAQLRREFTAEGLLE